MKCRTAGCGYFNIIDGTGWPDYVMVENDGDVFKGTYDVREYFPVNIMALLALANEMEGEKRDISCATCRADFGLACYDYKPNATCMEACLRYYARRIREALGVSE